MSRFLTEADHYAEAHGWRLVPLHGIAPGGGCTCRKGKECPSPGKHPRVKDWQNAATDDSETIYEWWERWPISNVGLRLGRESGVIDIEFDDEQGRRIAEEHLSECYTPTYKSGRSVHRLFKWNGALPAQAVVKCNGLEIRIGGGGNGAQSVLPPSRHHSGVDYEWLYGLSPSEVEPADVPESIMTLLWNNLDGQTEDGQFQRSAYTKREAEHWTELASGVGEGGRNNGMASVIGKMLRSIADINDKGTVELQYQVALSWNRTNCKPPLPDDEVRTTFGSCLKLERNRRESESMNRVFAENPEDTLGEKPKAKGWKLIIVQSEPPVFCLYAPWFRKAPDGCLRLTAKEIASAGLIGVASIAQAFQRLPSGFAKEWKRDNGLFDSIMATAEYRDAPNEAKRQLVVAERIREFLAEARPLPEGQKPPKNGWPKIMEDGSIVFRFNLLFDTLKNSADKVMRNEVSAILETIRANDYALRDAGERRRYKRLSKEGQVKLDEMCSIESTSVDAESDGDCTWSTGPSGEF